MSWQAPGSGRHRLLTAVDQMHAVLDDSGDVDPIYLSTEDRAELLTRLARLQDRVEARISGTLAVSDDVAQARGARSAGAWLAHERRVPHPRYLRAERLGGRLREHEAAASAAAAGELSAEHARAVVDSVEQLPDDIPGHDSPTAHEELLHRAERDLVKLARDHTPKQVRILGRRILEVTAPEAADAIEERLLAAEERRARERTELRFLNAGPGRTRVRAELPDHVADLLRKALEAYTNPRRVSLRQAQDTATSSTNASSSGSTDGGSTSDDDRTYAERQGDAFCQLLEHLPVSELPTHGGTPVSLVVTIEEDKLRAGVGAAQLDTGERLSVAAVRRLACEHGLMPAVLDGTSRVLDLGRSQRLFTAAQRTAHAVTHQTCQAEGCEVSAAWTEAHHKNDAWADGGTTDLEDLALLCGLHHHRAHDPAYETTWIGDEARFRRRQ